MSKAKTEEEVRQELLDYIHGIADYWATLPDKTPEERCNGLAFSMLNIFDGTTALPAFDLRVAPHPDDKQYHIDNEDDYYESGMLVNDCMLHEMYYS